MQIISTSYWRYFEEIICHFDASSWNSRPNLSSIHENFIFCPLHFGCKRAIQKIVSSVDHKSRVLLVPFFGQKSKFGPPFLESNHLILCPLQFTLSFRSAIYLPGTQSSIPKSLQSSKFFSKDWSSSNSIKQLSSNLCTLYCLLSYSTCVGHSKEEFRGLCYVK